MRWDEPVSEPKPKEKSFDISKQVVWDSYERVKANQGAAGVDGESIADFEADLKGNLYKLWNRMSSGSYFPPPVRCRQRCWKKDWVIDLDLKAFFDSIPHDLLLKAVSKHTDLAWVLLYVRRWLVAPLQREDGTIVERDRGTPQGSLCSAAHKEPYEQCRVMHSVGPSSLVKAASGTERCT